MVFVTKDIIPFSQANARLSELAEEVKQDREKIITKNGGSYIALVDAEKLDYYHQMEREHVFIIPNLEWFPNMGRPFLEREAHSIEGLTLREALLTKYKRNSRFLVAAALRNDKEGTSIQRACPGVPGRTTPSPVPMIQAGIDLRSVGVASRCAISAASVPASASLSIRGNACAPASSSSVTSVSSWPSACCVVGDR